MFPLDKAENPLFYLLTLFLGQDILSSSTRLLVEIIKLISYFIMFWMITFNGLQCVKKQHYLSMVA